MKSKIIAVQEELLRNSAWEFFLKSSAIRVVVLSDRQMTLQVVKEIEARYASYNNYMALNCSPSGNYPRKYDIYLFAPQNYEKARQFSISNPSVKTIVVSTPQIELNYEDGGNFCVFNWQSVSSIITGSSDKKDKSKPTPPTTIKKESPEVKIRRWSEPDPEPENNDGSIMDDINPERNDDDIPRVY